MKYIIICVTLLIFTACASAPNPPSQDAIQTAIAETQMAQPTSTFTLEPEASPTLRPTSTPRPISTKMPTATPVLPSPTPTVPGPDQMFARNFVAAQESGGMYVEIARVLFGKKEVLENQGFEFPEGTDFDNVDVVGEIIFKVVNNSDKVLSIYPDQAKVIVGGEQLDLWKWSLLGSFGDNYSGEIYPGVTAIGGAWFGLKRSDIPEINKLIIAFDKPVDKDYNSVGKDFYYEIDLTDHTWEELPEELK